MKMKRGAFFATILMLMSFGLAAQSMPDLVCQTSTKHRMIEIRQRQLSFKIPVYEMGTLKERIPASAPTLTNRLKDKALTQVTYFEGQRHKIFISDIFEPKSQGNTLTIRSRSGHEMTYPLECEVIAQI